MNREQLSKAISDIDDAFLAEAFSAPGASAQASPERTFHMAKFENKTSTIRSKRVWGLLLAACLVFALATTAYASNAFGLRDLFRSPNRELPEAVDPYIQQHEQSAAAAGWQAQITESLCDETKILATVTVTCNDQYVLVPTFASAEEDTSVIGLDGNQTLGDYAASQGKQLLYVGATFRDNKDLGVFTESQKNQNLSDSQMILLVEASRTGGAIAGNEICHVYALDEAGVKHELNLPVTLTQAPSQSDSTYAPADPNAIPGITVGEATVAQTPLGLSIRWKVTVSDEAVFNRLYDTVIEGIKIQEGGYVLEGDSWYFTVPMAQGTLGERMVVHFYDQDNQPMGDIVFQAGGSTGPVPGRASS